MSQMGYRRQTNQEIFSAHSIVFGTPCGIHAEWTNKARPEMARRRGPRAAADDGDDGDRFLSHPQNYYCDTARYCDG